MQIGIFAKTFVRPTLAETLDAVIAHDVHSVQFNLECAGLPSMSDQIDPAQADAIRHELGARGITMAAVSGTYNMIHPDLAQRSAGMRWIAALAGACAALGTDVITISTGTRDPHNMWQRHPDNDTAAAWSDMLAAVSEAVQIAEAHNVILAFEPEIANVVDSAAKARQLLDEIKSPHLKVVLDGANLFHAGELPRMREILTDAVDLLRDDIVLAHAKDLDHDGEAGHIAAGTGLLDYGLYLALLRDAGYNGSIVLHSLSEDQVGQCVAFLRAKGAVLRADGAR